MLKCSTDIQESQTTSMSSNPTPAIAQLGVQCAPSISNQCLQRCCTRTPAPPPPPASCPPQATRAGYLVCGRTPVNGECTVRCAQGFYGTNTRYRCVLVGGRPTYRPIGAVGVCLRVTFCNRFRCPVNKVPRRGLPATTTCTTAAVCGSANWVWCCVPRLVSSNGCSRVCLVHVHMSYYQFLTTTTILPQNCGQVCCADIQRPPPPKDCPARPPIPYARPCPCKPAGYVCKTYCQTGFKCSKPAITQLAYKCVIQNGIPTWVPVGNTKTATCTRNLKPRDTTEEALDIAEGLSGGSTSL
jgi:hypothetical protein